MVGASDSDMNRAGSNLEKRIPFCCGNVFLPKIWSLTKRDVCSHVTALYLTGLGQDLSAFTFCCHQHFCLAFFFLLPSSLRPYGYQTFRQSFSSCTRRTGDEPAFGIGVPPRTFSGFAPRDSEILKNRN